MVIVMFKINMQKKWRGLTPSPTNPTPVNIDETAALSIL